MSDTIAAVATGNIKAAIGIIRLSGSEAIDIAAKVFVPLNKQSLASLPPRKQVLGKLYSSSGEVIDNCLAVVSHAPNSYTGENTVEFHCHGSPVVLAAALKALFYNGARQARAGEFTKRAFLNGRLDLVQAEAVIDLIDSETEAAAKNAAAQLGGAVSRKTDKVYDSLVGISAHFHAIIDYPDEDIEPFKLQSYLSEIGASEKVLKSLLDSLERGQVMKEGIKAAIIGKPNAGKSSLLNALLGYDRAIVTASAGTTRDTIEEKLALGDVLLRLIDTAGLRDSADEAEKLGIERSRAAARDAGLVLAVFDGSKPLSPEDYEVIKASQLAPRALAIINKNDLKCILDVGELRKYYKSNIFVSALTGEGLSELSSIVKELLGQDKQVSIGEILVNSRQYDAISRAYTALLRAKAALTEGLTPDAVLIDTEEAIAALGELSGRTVRDDIVDTIFSRFCVGK
ncbi:MAG: tRNA uridine-5-carboxymethylaminomethyl(34) synthesis GTPase MnmE [Papillibacter sp.]|nr:tRNA uridine-5-carboxymethylaminomethyl(34) synthesis GTPase MnmE [Papillibacter sp.]